jgi:hypothetical protein
MKPLIAFEQLRLLFQKLEDLQIERDFYQATCLRFVPEELLYRQRQDALNDPEARRIAHANFERTLKSLEELTQMFVIEELSKAPPPNDQSN